MKSKQKAEEMRLTADIFALESSSGDRKQAESRGNEENCKYLCFGELFRRWKASRKQNVTTGTVPIVTFSRENP